MATKAAIFLDHLLDQIGDQVKYGTEVKADATDSKSWDSSELVEWAATQAGVKIADGSWKQYRELANDGNVMDVETALKVPGSLLFKFSSDPMTGMPNERQVMISLGNGFVVDASGKTVAVVAAESQQFTHAAAVPDFATNQTESEDLKAFVEQRLEHMDPVAPPTVEPPAAPVDTPKPEAKPDAKDEPKDDLSPLKGDAVTLRKQAHDEAQKAEELRDQAERGAKHQADIEAEAHQVRVDAQAKSDAADHEFVEGRMSKLEAESLEGAAKDAALKEAADHFAKSRAMKDEVIELHEKATTLDTSAKRAADSIADVKAEAAEWQDKSAATWKLSNRAIDADMPEMQLDGPSMLQEVKALEVPPPPPAGASEADIRKWVEQREAAETSMQAAGNQKLRDAAQLDDLAEVKRDLAADAVARAAAANANIASEQARADELQTRYETANGHATRLQQEMDEEQKNWETLKAAGDTEGMKLADQRANDLMMQHMNWSVQASDLQTRREAALTTIKAEEENAREYTDIGNSLRDEAQRAAVRSDEQEAAGNALIKQAETLDASTDPVQDALGLDIQTKVIVSGEENFEIEVPGRQLDDLTPDQRKELEDKLPGADKSDSDVEPAASPTSALDEPIPEPEPATIPEPDGADLLLNDEVAMIDTSTDSLMVDDSSSTGNLDDFA